MKFVSSIVACGFCAYFAAAVCGQGAPVQTQLFVGGLFRPVEMVQHPTDPSVQFVVQQNGIIRIVQNGVLGGEFLNISTLTTLDGERGLLGLAFSDDYPTDPSFYINHTANSGATNVVRYQHIAGDPLLADASTREVLFTVNQPFGNHNGGHLEIGPDGMLYIGMGDGGLANDPFENSQNINSLLGKMLRIDVSGAPGSGFITPPNNPFVGVAGNDLIWSYGLRNPWKFTFDTGPCSTGAMIIGDVGQDASEEIDYEPAGAGGRNYGWDCKEGTLDIAGDVGCSSGDPTLVGPIHEEPQPSFQSITGGYVYRGANMPANRGRYFYGDFVTRKVFSLGLSIAPNGEAGVTDVVDHTGQLGTLVLISSFARDAEGELYMIDYSGGRVFKLVGLHKTADSNLDGVVNSADLATLLAQWLDTGCGTSDLNNDGLVNSSDLATLLAQWG